MPWVEPIARRAAWVTIAAAIIAFLWIGKEFVFPMALAILLAFTLSPVVRWLHKRLRSRVAAVVIACGVGLTVVAGVGAAAAYQLVNFLERMPTYQYEISQKLDSFRGEGIIARAKVAFAQLEKQATEAAPSPAAGSATPPKDVPAMPVVVRTEQKIFDQALAISPAFHHVATAAMVCILVVLLLLYAEDLRDRILVLAGTQQISVTSQALEEAASKVGRYLLMLTIVNAGFGLGVAAGLYLIGIPNALLLGVLAGVLRYVPLVGAWMGALVPVLLAIAVVPGWGGVLWTLVLFAALEILANFLVEPFIYGHTTGISSTAVIVAILFWTLVWGGVGLLLAVPVTVCIVVFGKYVEPLRVFYVLLGDEPMLAGERRLYHRLVTGDVASSELIVRTALEETSATQVYDELLLPALRTARSDHARGVLSEERLNVVIEMLETLTAELQGPPCEEGTCSVACVAVETGDRVATRMAASAMGTALQHPVPILDSSMATDLQAKVEESGINVLMLVATSSESLVRGRLLSKVLAKRVPKLRVYVTDLGDAATTYVASETGSATIVGSITSAVEKVSQIVRGQEDVESAAQASAAQRAMPVAAV